MKLVRHDEKQPIARTLSVSLVGFLAWALIFGLAYAQAPLYASNQNQYFLHGAASANVGFLSQDWLANTRDMTPLFSFLTEFTFRFLDPNVFYAYYVLLFGIYVSSLFGIADTIFDLRESATKSLSFLVILIFFHSAILRLILTNALGSDWTYVFEGGVAGQRLLGDVFQPSSFGVLLLLSILLYLRKRVGWAVVSAIAACSIHPTYLLSAAALILAYMMKEVLDLRSPKRGIILGLWTFALVAPVVTYVAINFWPSSTEASSQAQALLINLRIPHHADPTEWLNSSVAIKFVIVIAGLGIARKSRLFWLLAVSLALALGLTILQMLLRSDRMALLFPWRISVILVPIGLAMISAYTANGLINRFPKLDSRFHRLLITSEMILIAICIFAGVAKFKMGLVRIQEDPSRPMLEFVDQQKQSGEVYLIPTKLQEFRMLTGAPAFIDFKSIPYYDIEVLEWYKRIRLAQFFYRDEIQFIDCGLLETIRETGGVTHVVLSRVQFGLQCSELQPVYEDHDYAVYTLHIVSE